MRKNKVLTKSEKEDLTVFFLVTFGLTIIMSIFMAKCYEKNNDAVIFTSIQALFPMIGVVVVLLRRKKTSRLKSFYILFLVISGISICCGGATLFLKYNVCMGIEDATINIGSLISIVLIFYFSDPNDKNRISIKKSSAKEWILYSSLFLILLFALNLGDSTLRVIIGSEKENYLMPIFMSSKNMLEILISFLTSPLTYVLCFINFLGEEYGWRRFLQPLLEKRFGMRCGVLILGLIWGVWHLPLCAYVYYETNWLFQFLLHIIACVSIAIFFAYVYLKTKNIWLITWLHFCNNTLAAILSDYIAETSEGVETAIVSCIIYLVVFLPFLKSKVFDDESILEDMFLIDR